MAVNKGNPWVRNLGGDIKPLIIKIRVAAGSSYEIKTGEICKVGIHTATYAAPVAAATDNAALVIAIEEQKATDVARMIPFVVPRPDDVFEFEMAAARAVEVGETFAISTSQKLVYATSNVCARIASDANYPEPEEKSVTARSLTYGQFCFDEQCSYWLEISGNS